MDATENVINVFSRVGLPFPLAAFNPSVPYLGGVRGVVDSVRDVFSTQGGGQVGQQMVDEPSGVELEPSVGEFGATERITGMEDIQPVTMSAVLTGGRKLVVRLWPEVMVSLDGQLSVKMDKADRAKYRGTVKQGALTDYTLSLKGVVMSPDDDEAYPASQLEQFRNFLEKVETLRIQCRLAQLYNIEQVVATRFSLQPIQGGMGAHNFTMTLVSDDPYPYTLLKG